MNTKTIVILGGSGNTGRLLARLLLQESVAELVLAGRNIDKAKQYAQELNHMIPGNRVKAARADASDAESLRKAFDGTNFVVVASSTTQYVQQVATAALEAGVDYLDIQYSSRKNAFLRSIEGEIHQAGRCFITDGGFHPGLPALLVRYAAQYCNPLVSARVGSVIRQDWNCLQLDDSTVCELVELINDFEMMTYKAGVWKKVSLVSTVDYLGMDFGEPFSRQLCAPMMLEEMRKLPEIYPTITDTGFYVGGFNWFVDWVVMPIAMVAMKLNSRGTVKPMGRLMYWGLKKFSKPPFGTLLRVEANAKKGTSENIQVTISHSDGYSFTAIPVAACLLQYLDGSIAKPGLWLQAHIVEPTRFMSDMQRMGITLNIIKGGQGEMEPK